MLFVMCKMPTNLAKKTMSFVNKAAIANFQNVFFFFFLPTVLIVSKFSEKNLRNINSNWYGLSNIHNTTLKSIMHNQPSN